MSGAMNVKSGSRPAIHVMCSLLLLHVPGKRGDLLPNLDVPREKKLAEESKKLAKGPEARPRSRL